MSIDIPEETLKHWKREDKKRIEMSIDIPEETLKHWREDFYILATKDKIDLPDYEFAERYFLSAKTSSYELKENLRKRGNNLSKECVELQKEIQKRDELLRQAKIEMLSWCDRNECDADDIHEWLKQYEELKR